jgi:hypothetical protein
MENDQQPNAELELGTEINPPMQTQEAKSDASQANNLADFFMRALSDGQIEAVDDNTVTNESENAEESEGQEDENVEQTDESDETQQTEATTQEEGEEIESPTMDAPRGVQKRLAKLTALRREAEERSKKLEEELESVKRSQAAPRANNPFSRLESEDAIKAEYDRQRKIRLFCERYPDGYYEGDNNQEHVSKEEINKAKVVALRAIEEHLPEQAEFVTAKKQYSQRAKKDFPWLNDPSDERSIVAKNLVKALPEIKRFPDYEIYAAQMALGMSTYKSQKEGARRGVQPQRVPVQPTMLSSAPRPALKRDEVEARQSSERFQRSGSVSDLADVFKSKFV